MTTTRSLCSLFVLLASTCGVLQAAPSGQDLKSDWVEISFGGIMGVDGAPQLALGLKNKTNQAVWVQVRMVPPAPNTECAMTMALAPGKGALHSCAQERVVPDADYPIFVTVYRDEALTDQAETRQTAMRFTKRDAEPLPSVPTVPGLPATFDDVVASEKPVSLGNAMFGAMRASGTLVVTRTALQYTFKEKVTEIPVAQIRSVVVREAGPIPWVVVQYSEGSAIRTYGFQGSSSRGAGPRVPEIYGSILFAWSKFKSSAADSAAPASDPH